MGCGEEEGLIGSGRGWGRGLEEVAELGDGYERSGLCCVGEDNGWERLAGPGVSGRVVGALVGGERGQG